MAVPTWTLALVGACIVVAIAALAVGLATSTCGTTDATIRTHATRARLQLAVRGSRVPKILWQTWGTHPLPVHMAKTVDALKAAHPDFQHVLMDDAQCLRFIQQHFPITVEHAFRQLVPGAYRADLWRLCVLYTIGGVYIDIKFKPVKSFSFHSMLDGPHFVEDLPSGNVKGIYNACMIAPPGDVRLHRMIQQIVENVRTRYYGKCGLEPTGPQLVVKFIPANSPDVTMKLLKRPHRHCVICDRQGKWLLETYPEYRQEQRAHQLEPHYGELWQKKAVYRRLQPLAFNP